MNPGIRIKIKIVDLLGRASPNRNIFFIDSTRYQFITVSAIPTTTELPTNIYTPCNILTTRVH